MTVHTPRSSVIVEELLPWRTMAVDFELVERRT